MRAYSLCLLLLAVFDIESATSDEVSQKIAGYQPQSDMTDFVSSHLNVSDLLCVSPISYVFPLSARDRLGS
jgi:hypothetical protein